MGTPREINQLEGFFQHYEWGGKQFIGTIARLPEGETRPVAEFWLGTHVLGPSVVQSGDERIGLDQLIAADPVKYLGNRVAARFGRLPYLLKVLDVHDMLSIQVHPSKATAEASFARENGKGISLQSPVRNYKDDNHKPELMVALSDEFWLLHGFKPLPQLQQTLEQVPEFASLLPVLQEGSYQGLYKRVMTLPATETDSLLRPLLDRIIPLYREGALTKDQEDFWAARAALTFSPEGPADRGIFSIYFFNLVHLRRGDAIFQDAGVPHAYLEGQNVEIMANSDNVLRGGLTNKHIDTEELVNNIRFEATHPVIISGDRGAAFETVYTTGAPDFVLSSFEVGAGRHTTFTTVTTEILLLTAGKVLVTNGPVSVELYKGQPAAVLFPGTKVQLWATEKAVVFRASVPV